MLTAQDRAAAIYTALEGQGRFAGLNADEKTRVRQQLETVYGADVTYLQAAATILPGTLQNPAGQPVSTPTGPGATASPISIVGAGVLR